ncbi:hypothetical protein BDZ97DRAFT_1783040 [Flammula alnicola]|nr:hypothetical protein BDZ97DRAFT_1783040 [Flammula alnicola]
MSRVELDEDAQQFRVVIPLVKKLPPNPHIGDGNNALVRALAPPSDTAQTDSEWSPESRDDKALRHRLLACDQRSFLTGSAVADLQAARIINAVRNNVTLKREVEDYLTQQRLQPPSIGRFLLDSTNNAILLESNLRIQWELYGTYCFVPAEDDANAMLDALRQSNEEWGHVSKAPFHRPSWDVIVLHPHALLPEGLALGIAKDRSFYVTGQPAPPASQLTWTWWTASGDCLRSNLPPNDPLTPFTATDVRSEFRLSPFSSLAMVINAHCKLQQFMRDHGPSASSRVQKFAQLMSELVTEIFFVPDGFNNVAALAQPLQVAQHAQSMAGTIPSQAVQAAGQSSAAGNKFYVNPAYGGLEEASAPSGEDRLSCAVEYPERPDTDGLTDSEFRLVSAKARDPRLDGKERADAAMMMLFGTHRYEDPYVHGSQAIG